MGSTNSGRNSGLDIGRILAMSLVILFHIVGSGMDGCTDRNSAILWVQGFSACCVNLFGLLTGYLCVDRGWRPGRILHLWLEVAVIGILTSMILGDVRLSHLVYDVCPLISTQYWYFTAYVGLFFLIPVLNGGLQAVQQKTLNVILGAIGVLIGIASLSRHDVFDLGGGFSVAWLVVLYVIGGGVKLNKQWIELHLNKRIAFCFAMICGTLNVCHIALAREVPLLSAYFKGRVGVNNYTQPMCLLTAVFLLIGCSLIRVRGGICKKILAFYSSAAFGVYLIQTNPACVRVWRGCFHWVVDLNWFCFASVLVLLPVAIYVALGTIVATVKLMAQKVFCK